MIRDAQGDWVHAPGGRQFQLSRCGDGEVPADAGPVLGHDPLDIENPAYDASPYRGPTPERLKAMREAGWDPRWLTGVDRSGHVDEYHPAQMKSPQFRGKSFQDAWLDTTIEERARFRNVSFVPSVPGEPDRPHQFGAVAYEPLAGDGPVLKGKFYKDR